MKKITKQKPQEKKILEVLKKLTSGMENTAVDINSMKNDLNFVSLRLGQVERNTEIMKVDMRRMGEDIGEFEVRLNKRLTDVADLITAQLGSKLQNHERRIKKLEHIQQSA